MATRRRTAMALDQQDFDQLQRELTELRAMKSQNEGMAKVLEWQAVYGERIDNLLSTVEDMKGTAKEIQHNAKRVEDDHGKRIAELEKKQAESTGERRMFLLLAGLIGGMVSEFAGKFISK